MAKYFFLFFLDDRRTLINLQTAGSPHVHFSQSLIGATKPPEVAFECTGARLRMQFLALLSFPLARELITFDYMPETDHYSPGHFSIELTCSATFAASYSFQKQVMLPVTLGP